MTLTIKDIKAPVLMVSAMNYNKQIRYQYHHILTGDKYEALMTPVSKARHIRGFERMHLATLWIRLYMVLCILGQKPSLIRAQATEQITFLFNMVPTHSWKLLLKFLLSVYKIGFNNSTITL